MPFSPPDLSLVTGCSGTIFGVVLCGRIIDLDRPFPLRKIGRTDARHREKNGMSNWKHNAKAAISALAFLGVSAVIAHADSFGAISLSPETGATGWSHDYSSRWEAEEVAQSHCDRNADDCRTAIWFKNGCGAVARGADGGWGADWASGRRQAQRAAMASCSNHSDSCRVVRWQCSGAN